MITDPFSARQLLKDNGLTLAQAAEAIGMNSKTLAAYLNPSNPRKPKDGEIFWAGFEAAVSTFVTLFYKDATYIKSVTELDTELAERCRPNKPHRDRIPSTCPNPLRMILYRKDKGGYRVMVPCKKWTCNYCGPKRLTETMERFASGPGIDSQQKGRRCVGGRFWIHAFPLNPAG